MFPLLIEQLINGLALGGVYALVAVGFSLIFGVLRLFHISHGDVFMFSGYIVVTLVGAIGQLPLIAILPIGIVVGAFIGFLVERTAFKPFRKSNEIIPLISGIGISLILQNLAMIIWGPEQYSFNLGADLGWIEFGNIRITGIRIVILLSSVILVLIFNYWLFRTRTGRAVRATAIDPITASMMGIKPDRIITITFLVGSALAGAATVLVGALYGAIYPSLGFSIGLKAFAASILGGLGSMSGAVLGGLILGVLEVATAGYVNVAYQDAIAMGILILVLLLRPNGILGKSMEEKL